MLPVPQYRIRSTGFPPKTLDGRKVLSRTVPPSRVSNSLRSPVGGASRMRKVDRSAKIISGQLPRCLRSALSSDDKNSGREFGVSESEER